MVYVYEFGIGVTVDRKRALIYYDKAAALGSPIAKQAAANLTFVGPTIRPNALPQTAVRRIASHAISGTRALAIVVRSSEPIRRGLPTDSP